MTAMNETSTITLPEYHNLLALLLLNLNTPSVSSSYTTQEEEMIKKKRRRDNAHTESGARQQNRAGRQVPDPDKDPDLTHKTHHQKRKTQTKPVYHQRARKHKPYTREKNHTPKRQNKKEKPHDTFPPHQPCNLATTQPTQTRIQSLPHTSFLHPCRHPFLHPTRIPSTRLLTPATIPLSTYCLPSLYTPPVLPPIVTVPPPVSTLLLATVPMPVSVSLPLALNLCSAP